MYINILSFVFFSLSPFAYLKILKHSYNSDISKNKNNNT